MIDNAGAEDAWTFRLTARLTGTKLIFSLYNQSAERQTVNRGFAHRQNMYLVVLEESGFGEVLEERMVLSDPAIGDYGVESKGRVEESFNLSDSFPGLGSMKGSAIVFWSTDIVISRSEDSFETERYGGSVRIELPLVSKPGK